MYEIMSYDTCVEAIRARATPSMAFGVSFIDFSGEHELLNIYYLIKPCHMPLWVAHVSRLQEVRDLCTNQARERKVGRWSAGPNPPPEPPPEHEPGPNRARPARQRPAPTWLSAVVARWVGR